MRHAAWALVACVAAGAAAEPVRVDDAKDRQLVQALLAQAGRVPRQMTPEYCRKLADQPEDITWVGIRYLSIPLTAYELTGDANYLQVFVDGFENLRSVLTKGPDGFLGWYGKPISTFRDPKDPEKKVDVIITSFRVTEELCRFLELAAGDPSQARRYARQRQDYLELMENHLVRKWDARGNYVELGKTGAVYRTHAGLKDVKAHLTQPHNKHSIIIQAMLGLYRITGKDEYAAKAVRLGTRYKHCLALKDGHYVWNYWDPAGAWDVNPGDQGKWKHWIGVEHKGGYYASSLTQAVVLYQHGLVLDKADVDRFLKTQLQVAWNGDLANPKWARVDGTTSEQYMTGEYICSALAPYDAKIAEFLYSGPRQEERLKAADHPWQGGPVLDGWLRGKLLELPAARKSPQPYAEYGQKFLANAANKALAELLASQVTGSGYRAPQSPQEMRPMPTPPNPGR